MKTRDFIYKAFYKETGQTRCGSVFADSNGDIYSYGYHYPLLFTVGNKVVRNVRGYSNSTARHISWTRDIEAIDVHTLGGFRLTGDNESILIELIRGQRQYIRVLEETLASKKRSDTQVYRSINSQIVRARINLGKLISNG